MDEKELISVDQAHALIDASMIHLEPMEACLDNQTGLTVSEDIYSPLDLPPFDQSAMDGYAVRAEEMGDLLTVQGVVQAGHSGPVVLKNKNAIRIFTGGPLPAGADTVVMQEKTEEKILDDRPHIRITDLNITPGTHVRKKGSEIQKDELIIPGGTKITAPVCGLIASLGIEKVKAFRRLSVTVLATGNELQKPGILLEAGQIYESNVYFLRSALQPYTTNLTVLYVEDCLSSIQQKIRVALEQSDMILLTGGVSVGDFDFVRRAADNNGVGLKFHGVKQKPGKPLYFGTLDKTMIFGLPGNPASVITCFYEYVLPTIKTMMHLPLEERQTAILKSDFRKIEGLTQFLKGYLENGIVEILGAQESYRLRSFSSANCLVRLDQQRLDYQKGESVSVRPLPK